MRTLLPFLLLLAPAACAMAQQDGARIVDACRRGDPSACRPRPLAEQSVLDANAILMGMQSSSLSEATTQGGAR